MSTPVETSTTFEIPDEHTHGRASSERTARRTTWASAPATESELLLEREWLATNGLGGYASGTISGACTRRYHGLLIAALPAPLGRMVMFNHLAEELKFIDRSVLRLDWDEPLSIDEARLDQRFGIVAGASGEFTMESGLPVWRYKHGPYQIEKRVVLPHLQNTVLISYKVLAAPEPIRLRLRPSFHFRAHEAAVSGGFASPYTVAAFERRVEIRSDNAPPLRMLVVTNESSLVLDGGRTRTLHYRLERARGYEYEGEVWSPGYFRVDLAAGEEAVLVGSTDDWDTVLAVNPDAIFTSERQRRERLLSQAGVSQDEPFVQELVHAADQFIIRPNTRTADRAMAQASGDDARTVIAGYHWFTDWGRDTMISLEGLTLATGRHAEAGYLLRTFGRYVRDGLIPNLFPEGHKEGLYHTADATLWYFHALNRYLETTGDRTTLEQLLPTLYDIVDHHVRGTHYGIHVDPDDGLLSQGADGYQLTWMDAKVADWVVTPRRGKAVEINALWYNALRLMQRWTRETGDDAASQATAARADHAAESFNRRFWNADGGYLYDVVDGEQGDDAALRPNQLFAISLDHPVLDESRWKRVLEKVKQTLLTPVGLRSLAPGHPDYKATYDGDLRCRDAAYHQGTVWGWLIGPYIDALLRVYPDQIAEARQALDGFAHHMSEACVGSISEIFDAEEPFLPRGCIAQAWSVAEVLRCLRKTSPELDRGQ
jgi:predicted glycogen debranching enzyme